MHRLRRHSKAVAPSSALQARNRSEIRSEEALSTSVFCFFKIVLMVYKEGDVLSCIDIWPVSGHVLENKVRLLPHS